MQRATRHRKSSCGVAMQHPTIVFGDSVERKRSSRSETARNENASSSRKGLHEKASSGGGHAHTHLLSPGQRRQRAGPLHRLRRRRVSNPQSNRRRLRRRHRRRRAAAAEAAARRAAAEAASSKSCRRSQIESHAGREVDLLRLCRRPSAYRSRPRIRHAARRPGPTAGASAPGGGGGPAAERKARRTAGAHFALEGAAARRDPGCGARASRVTSREERARADARAALLLLGAREDGLPQGPLLGEPAAAAYPSEKSIILRKMLRNIFCPSLHRHTRRWIVVLSVCRIPIFWKF